MPGSTTCPACGVAVVPGYVRCPKCRAALPQARAKGQVGASSGGTAVEAPRAFPVVPVLIAVVVGGGIIAYFGLSGGKHAKPAQAQPQTEQAVPVANAAAGAAAGPAEPASAGATPTGPQPDAVANQLERNLRRQRLWSTVEVHGDRVDVRSSSCSEAAMASSLDDASGDLKAAGLTKLRCLEQSGRVVIERDL